MKKKMLAATLLMGLLAACGGNSASIVGSWVEPVPGLEGQVQEGTKLILTGKSIGNGQTIEFVDTMDIKRLTADSLVLDNQGMEIRYAKQK